MPFTAGLRAIGLAALAAASTLTLTASPVAAANPPAAAASTIKAVSVTSAAARVVTIAEAQRGKRYAYGAAGPSAFDCSGLVLYAYRMAGLGSRIGGGHSGYAMLSWARANHRLSRSSPQIGDVVIYGRGAHAAIYIGGGRVISALNRSLGIRITGLHALHLRVTGFIHTRASAIPLTTAASAKQHTSTKKAPQAAATVRTLGYANLRAGATTAAHVVAVVGPGTRLRVTGSTRVSGARWIHVAYLGHSAWVRGNLVRAA